MLGTYSKYFKVLINSIATMNKMCHVWIYYSIEPLAFKG